ncbi:hypothetical protein ACTI_80630 [Actinoplanes sp. OR16]|uniref:hypothetical protein n=1 Tax=Actinoplanes sp. OR16 TaxID=946334 RepID=UPI000F6F2F85|nr:hypothetical protein [Actinoplanes sp. OR16]BBH71378.1 hypothetical protein ACTI_80630 [Actinoplanes sp. OR16]
MPRPDWRERFALGADVALIGILTTVVALPVLTAPAALAAGSSAIRHRYTSGSLPPLRPLLHQFRHGLLRGLPVILLAAALLLDLTAIGRGWVPGGPLLLILTAAAIAWLAGVAGLTLVIVGRNPQSPWRAAARIAGNQPKAVAAISATGVLAFFLALTIPVTIPLLVGIQLFAAHILADRLSPFVR